MALQKDYAGTVTFIIADVATQEGSELARQFSVSRIPHVVIMEHNGDIIFSGEGYKTKGMLENELSKLEGI